MSNQEKKKRQRIALAAAGALVVAIFLLMLLAFCHRPGQPISPHANPTSEATISTASSPMPSLKPFSSPSPPKTPLMFPTGNYGNGKG